MKHWVDRSPWKIHEETLSLPLTNGKHTSLALNMKLMSLALVMKAKYLALDSEFCPC